MYSETDYIKAKENAKLRIWMGIALICAFVAVMGVCTAFRLKALNMIVAGVGFAVCWFFWDLKITPYVRYNRFMKDLHGGQRRKLCCRFVEISDETRLYDGVEVYDVTVSVRDDDDTITLNDEDRRLFVFDADKDFPALEHGDRLTVTSFGSFITGIEKQ